MIGIASRHACKWALIVLNQASGLAGGYDFKRVLEDIIHGREATDAAIAGSIQSKDTGDSHEVTVFYSFGLMMFGVFRVVSGRAITSADLMEGNRVVVGGSKVLEKLGVQPRPGGKIMTSIGELTIVGVFGARIDR